MAKLSLFDQRRRRVRTALRAKGGSRPRLSIHRTSQHIYAQVIDDARGVTVASASTLEKDVRDVTGATKDAASAAPAPLACCPFFCYYTFSLLQMLIFAAKPDINTGRFCSLPLGCFLWSAYVHCVYLFLRRC